MSARRTSRPYETQPTTLSPRTTRTGVSCPLRSGEQSSFFAVPWRDRDGVGSSRVHARRQRPMSLPINRFRSASESLSSEILRSNHRPSFDPALDPPREIGRFGAHRDRRVHGRTAARNPPMGHGDVVAEMGSILGVVLPIEGGRAWEDICFSFAETFAALKLFA
jgi:hypothetical protein